MACFGPKLYVGTGEGSEADVLYAMVTLYVQEKTGVESIRVVYTDTQDPLTELDEERVDLTFAPEAQHAEVSLLRLSGYPVLVTGKRRLEDLQSTTVVPAIRKLAGLLKSDDVVNIITQVQAGDSAMAAVRRFYMERRWI